MMSLSDRYSVVLLKRMPILDWLPRYDIRRDLKHDVLAGFTVAVILVPQEVSLAAMMGVPSEYGLYTAAVAPLIYPIFGSSRALSVANAAEGSLLVGVLLRSAEIESMAERVATGILLTFLSGALMVLGGLLHQGGLVSFFSRTAMNGYVTATACLIVLSQIPPWLGVKLASPDLTIFTAIDVVAKLPDTNGYSLGLGVVSLVVLCACKALRTRLQVVVVAAAAATRSRRYSVAVKSLSDASRPSDGEHSHEEHDEHDEHDDGVDEATVELRLHDSSDVRGATVSSQHHAKRTDSHKARATGHAAAAVADSAHLLQQSQSSPMPPPPSFLARHLMHRPRLLFVMTLLCDGGALLVCMLGIAVGAALGDDKLTLTGAVHRGLPSPVFPPAALGAVIPWHRLQSLAVHSVVIATVLFMASVAAGSKLAAQDGSDIAPNQELLGLGFANLGASLFQGMPSSAGMSRSAVNAQSAHTPLASMVTALLVIFTTLFLTGPLYYLPQAPLAAIVLLSALALIEFSEPRWLRRVRPHEFSVWLGAFGGTLCCGLLLGLGISLVASLCEIMARTKKPEVFLLGQRPDGTFWKLLAVSEGSSQQDNGDDVTEPSRDDASSTSPQALPDVVIVHMEQDVYFGNARHLIHAIERELRAAKARSRVLGAVIDGARTNDLDATALHLLREYQQKLAARDQLLLFANLRRETETQVIQSGLVASTSDVTADDRDASATVKKHHRPSDSLASAVASLRQ